MRKLRWGILGTASIARRQVVPALMASHSGEVLAVASRDAERAAAFAASFGIPKSYGSYEALLADDDVEAVYIPLPNHLHLPWILRAVEAGKHVLCEKPIALSAAQVDEIIAASQQHGRFVMEAMCAHFHPVHDRARTLVAEGAIGRVQLLRLSLANDFRDRPGDVRWRKEWGGGGLLDLGCYLVRTARMLLQSEPVGVVAQGQFDPHTDVDVHMAITLLFPGDVTAFMDCGIATAARNSYEIIGDQGRIVVDRPFGNAVESRGLTVHVPARGETREEVVTAHQIKVQMEAVSRAILDGAPPPVPLAESRRNMEILDACMASARAGGRRIDVPCESALPGG